MSSEDPTKDMGLRDLINQLAINVAVLTSSLDDMKGVMTGLKDSTASKEAVTTLTNEVQGLKQELKSVDEKHEKKWDRLLWAVFSLVLGAVVLAALSGGFKP